MNNFISSDKIITTEEYRNIHNLADLLNDFSKKIEDYRSIMVYNKLDIDKTIMFNELYQFKEEIKNFGLILKLNEYKDQK